MLVSLLYFVLEKFCNWGIKAYILHSEKASVNRKMISGARPNECKNSNASLVFVANIHIPI